MRVASLAPLVAVAALLSCARRPLAPDAPPPRVAAAAPAPAPAAPAALEMPSLASLDGDPVRLASLRGRVVLVHFWTFGWINCENMIPRYGEWDQRLRERGLTVVGVHTPESEYERNPANLARYVRTHGIRWRVVLDPDNAAWRAFNVRAWPTIVLIDRDGVERGRWVGDASGPAIDAALTRLFGAT